MNAMNDYNTYEYTIFLRNTLKHRAIMKLKDMVRNKDREDMVTIAQIS